MSRSARKAILVLGMHRSGTSALAGVLHRLGVPLGSGLLPANRFNEAGYWELEEIVRAHERLLQGLGLRWDVVAPWPDEWWRSAPAEAACGELLDILRRNFDGCELFAVKDPRMSRLLPLWRRVLRAAGCRPVAALVLRHPLEVAASLESREGFDRRRSHLLWLDHLARAETDSRQMDRMLVGYAELLRDWRAVVRRLAAAGSLEWPRPVEEVAPAVSEFLSPALRHHVVDERAERSQELPARVAEAYSRLRAEGSLDDRRLRAWMTTTRHELRDLEPLFYAQARDLRALITHLAETEHDLASHRTAKAELERELVAWQERATAAEGELVQQRADGRAGEEELAQLRAAQAALEKKLTAQLESRSQLEAKLETMADANSQLEQLQVQMASEQAASAKVASELAEARGRAAVLEKELVRERQTVASRRQRLERLGDELSSLREEASRKQHDLAILESRLEAERNRAQALLLQLEEQHVEAGETVAQARTELRSARAELELERAAAARRHRRLEDRLSEALTRESEALARERESGLGLAEARAELKRERRELERARREVDGLRARLEVAEDRQRATAALLEEVLTSRSWRLTGWLRRLAARFRGTALEAVSAPAVVLAETGATPPQPSAEAVGAPPGELRYRIETFEARFPDGCVGAVLIASGWCRPPAALGPVRLELRCDGKRLAAAECAPAPAGAPHPHFQLQAELPPDGETFELVTGSGQVLVNATYASLWPPRPRHAYDAFCSSHRLRPQLRQLMERDLERLRRRPRVSVLVRAVAGSHEDLAQTLESLRRQVYADWEACIAVDRAAAGRLAPYLESTNDSRIRHLAVDERAGWALGNAAAGMASGELLGVLRPGDRLAPEALFEVVRRLEAEPTAELLYSDHDCVDRDGVRSDPRLKPGWSPIFLLGYDYVGRSVFLRRKLFEAVGGYRPGFDGAEEYDLILRLADGEPVVAHLPQVLYHARRSGGGEDGSVSGSGAARRSAVERRGLAATLPTAAAGAVENLEWPDDGPRVTIVVPTYNQEPLLRRCVESIFEKTSYRNFDLLVVDNGSDCAETLRYLGGLRDRGVTVLEVPRDGNRFSFSHVNNVAVRSTDADYVLLLNNDTEVVEPRWLSRMMGYCRLPGVGATGARLSYPDGSIQHAGVALRMNEGPFPGHLFLGQRGEASESQPLVAASREVSAVTAACLLTERRLFEELGGLDEERLSVAFGDIDYCLRLGDRGLRTVYVAGARLLHKESSSRGRQDHPAERAAYQQLHGRRCESYLSPNASYWLGRAPRLQPHCRGHLAGLLERPLRLLWAEPEEPEEKRGLGAGALAALESTGPVDVERLPAGAASLAGHWQSRERLHDRIRQVTERIESATADLVVADGYAAMPVIAAAAAASVPSIWLLSEHREPEELAALWSAPAWALLPHAMRSAQRVVFDSHRQRILWRDFGDRLNFETIPAAALPAAGETRTTTDVHAARPPTARRSIVCPVGPGAAASWRSLLEAVRPLAARRRDFQLLLLCHGPAPALRELQEAVHDLDLTGLARVEAAADVPAAYATADILAVWSASGLQPEDLLLGLAHGLPIVSAERWGRSGRVVDGLNALTTKPRDSGALLAALESLLEDAALRRRLGEGSRLMLANQPDAGELAVRMRQLLASVWQAGSDNEPSFGFLVDAGDATPEELGETFESLERQTYTNWRLAILQTAEGSKEQLRLVEQVESVDHRVEVLAPAEAEDVAARLDRGLELVGGRWVGVLGAGERLAPYALSELAGRLDRRADTELLYTDEQRLHAGGRRELRLKPGWSPEALLGEFYPGRVWLARRDVIQRAGGFRSGYDGAEEWELWLRLLEAGAVGQRLALPCVERPARSRPASAPATAVRAVQDHLRRRGLEADVEPQRGGRLRARWPVTGDPLVSVIVPNRDSWERLEACVDGLLYRTDYARLELVIVDSGSRDPRVLELYHSLEERGRARIVQFTSPFNYSAACNLGVRHSSGEHLLFLNNDVEMLASDWLEEMARWTRLEGVGVVGAKLLYEDGRIQHAGVTLGLHGLAGHLFYQAGEEETEGVFGSADEVRNLSAVTGACQLIPRTVFEELGGFEEEYSLIYSDVAICVRAIEAGYRVVYTPYARLLHLEGKTRGTVTPLEDELRFARLLEAAGIDEDPFFHPGLHAWSPRPVVRGPADQGNRSLLLEKRRARTRELVAAPLDFCDPEAIGAVLARHGLHLPPPAAAAEDAGESDTSAASLILATLMQEAELRRRFERPLSAGTSGGYCRWLCGEWAARQGLSDAARERIRRVFAKPPGDLVHRVYSNRPDLHVSFPFALTPVGQRFFLPWIVAEGISEWGLPREAVWWFFLAAAEDPARGLLEAYQLNAGWQLRWPAAATAFGWRPFAEWLRSEYPEVAEWIPLGPPPNLLPPIDELRLLQRAQPELLRAAPDAFRVRSDTARLVEIVADGNGAGGPVDAGWRQTLQRQLEEGLGESQGVNVIGNFCYPSGVQQAALGSVAALAEAGVRTSLRDMPTAANPVREGSLDRWRDFLGFELFDQTLLHVQPDLLPRAYHVCGLAPRRDLRRVGVWFWELESPPPESWVELGSSLDEVWTFSEFVAESLRTVMPMEVVAMPPGLQRPRCPDLPRSLFGLEDGKLLFYFSFDMFSRVERKNPWGLIRAFRRAFRPGDDARLVIRTLRGEHFPEETRRLRREADEAGVILMDRLLSRAESFALIKACDCYVSLHRSEGFGLPLAEAMLLEKPVIATAYSGNMQFMNPGNSLLVDFRRVEIADEQPPYPAGGIWAEPDERHAAELMRWVFENPGQARALGRRARRELESGFSMRAAGERMARRLASLR